MTACGFSGDDEWITGHPNGDLHVWSMAGAQVGCVYVCVGGGGAVAQARGGGGLGVLCVYVCVTDWAAVWLWVRF